MGHKRWLQFGVAYIVAGVLIVHFGTSAAYSALSAAWASGSLNQESLTQAVQHVQLWRCVGGFTAGIGVIAVAAALCFRWFVKHPAPNPDAPSESN